MGLFGSLFGNSKSDDGNASSDIPWISLNTIGQLKDIKEASNNRPASEFGVMHQSPQMLIIKNGVVVIHDSHGAISDIKLEQYI